MKLLVTLILSLLANILTYSQLGFVKSIDVDEQTDEGVAIRVISDGYLLLAGSYCFSNTLDCYSILKTDFSGNIVWKKQIKNNLAAIKPVDGYSNHGIHVANDDEIFYSGVIQNPTTLLDCFIMKTDSQGDSIWLHTYGSPYNDFSSTLFQNTDSTLLLFSDLATDPNNDVIWLLETDLEGKVIWENTYGELNRNVARQDILQLNNGDLVFTHFSCERNDVCFFGDTITLNITKVNNQGDVIWNEAAYKFTEYWSNSSMISLDNGGFLLSFYRTNLESGWFYPPIFIWIDSMGNVTKEYLFPENAESTINDIIKTSSGLVVGAGYVDKFDLGFAGWVFAMNQEGDLLWNKEIVDLRFPARVMSFNAVEESENGGLILTGFIVDTLTNHIPAKNDKNVVLVKLDSIGCLEPGCNDLQIVSDISEVRIHNQELKFYPNPVSDELCLENISSSLNFNNQVVIINSMGQLEMRGSYNQDNKCYDVSSLTSGIYIVEVLNKNAVLQTFRIVIVK